MTTLDHHPPVADVAIPQERLTPPLREPGHDPRAGAEVATSTRTVRLPVCATCGAAFATDGALQRHLLDAYHGFQCLRCGALFGQPSALDVHCLIEHRTPLARPYARAQSTDEAWSGGLATRAQHTQGAAEMTIPPVVAPHLRGHDAPPERILLLALLPIGDSLLTTPTIGALRVRYPRARITALVYSRTAALMRCVPAIDEVAVLPLGPDWAGVAPLAHALRSLRAARFDVAIDFTSPAYQAIGLACGIPIQTSLKVDPLWWLLPGPHRRWRATHATEHYYDAAREFGLPPWASVDHRLTLRVPASACTEADRFLHQQAGRHEGRPLVGIHAGGRWLDGLKQWPPARFAELAQRLQRRWNARIVLLGGPEEEASARAIADEAGGDIIIAAGALPLLTSLALVARCDLFVGNDSSLLHAAAALGTPYVGIFGPTCPANYAPVAACPGQGVLTLPPQPCRVPRYFVGGSTIWHRSCCRGTCAALRGLAVDTVLAQTEMLLGPRRAATHEQEQEPERGSDTPAEPIARQTA